MKFPHLFAPIKIRDLELKNRVVFPAMGTGYPDNCYVTDRLIDYHVARVLGGSGLNITEAAHVHAPSAITDTLLKVCDDCFIPGLKKFTDAIHKAGGKAGIQLWQAGSVASSDPNAVVAIPSTMIVYGKEYQSASIDLIQELVHAYGEAAKRAVEAGFDCVELHTGHGYSPHAFLSGAMNKRTDEYGGSLENRARYPLEIIAEIRRNIPEGMPILMRIVAKDDYVENGLTIEEVIQFSKMAHAAGVDALDVSRGNKFPLRIEAAQFECPSIDHPRGFNIENAARIKEETGILTIGVGRINDPQQAEDYIASGKVDMVVIGRGQIADPEFCNKAFSGNDEDILRCIGCNQGCVGRIAAQAEGNQFVQAEEKGISCTRNPSVGKEKDFSTISPTDHPKKVLIIGGGPAGLEAAITLKKRGHNPILFEEKEQLGGQFILAGLAPRKAEMKVAALSRGEQAKKLSVDIRMNTKVTPEILKEESPDEVIIAIGALPIKLRIPGIDLPNVLNFSDVLNGVTMPHGEVIVIGGGLVGIEVAEYVAEKDSASKVTIVEMLNEVGKEHVIHRRIPVMENLAALGIESMVNTKCLGIGEKSMLVEKDGEKQELPCDYVVAAVGSVSVNSDDIKDYCTQNQIPYHMIGDAVSARRVINATAEAVEVSRNI